MDFALEFRLVARERKRLRVFRLLEQATLFGDTELVVEWGRIGNRLRTRVEAFTTSSARLRRRAELVGFRRRHGYVETSAATATNPSCEAATCPGVAS